MATVALTTTPVQIDDGTSYTVLVTNTGAGEVDLSRGGRLRPGQSRTLYPEGTALTAAATSGTGTVTTSTTSKPLPNAADPTALAANAAFTGTYAPRSTKRRIDPSRWVLSKPSVMATPPTLTAGVANAASAIASSVLVKAMESGAFTFGGGPVTRGTTFPNYTGLLMGHYPQLPQATSDAPTAVEFILDTADSTGRFEISTKGTNGPIRVCVLNSSGRWEYATTTGSFTTHAADGSGYLDLVTLGAAGRYNIRLEMSGSQVFFGIRLGPTDTLVGRKHAGKRYIAAGDSFSEPTIVDSNGFVNADGWPTVLSHMTGLDIWGGGSGGTGYLKTNGARVKLRDRLATDILAFNPDGILWPMGINDYPSFTAAQIGAEALLCFQQALAYNADIDNVVIGPWYPKTITSGAVSNLLATRDAIAASAATVGARFLDPLSLPISDYLTTWSSTLSSSAGGGATSISVASLPTYFTGQVGVGGLDTWYVQVGGGLTTAEVRAVTNISGSGPYTLTVAALTNAHTAGETVSLCGPSYITGTGKQGTTTGSGNADRYTGSDGTHPTVPGHTHIASTIAWLWARSIQLSP
jgi:hypothetical protein